MTTVPAHTLDESQVTRRFDAAVGVHICEGNALKKGGQVRDRTVDIPIFRRKRNSQLDFSSNTQSYTDCRGVRVIPYGPIWCC